MMLKVDQDGNKQRSRFSDQPDNSAYDAIEASDEALFIGRKDRRRYEDIRIIKTNSRYKNMG